MPRAGHTGTIELNEPATMDTKVPYHAKEYDVYVVLGAPGVTPWHWRAWTGIEPLLSRFVCSDRGKPLLRSTQTSGTGRQYREVAFGRMGWEAKAHERWTHDSPSADRMANPRTFLSTEVWAPSWNVCVKSNEPPDFYLHLIAASPGREADVASQFDSILVVALQASAPDVVQTELRTAMASVATLLRSPIAVTKRRAWGVASGEMGGFRDAIQDFGVGHGLFKNSDPQTTPLGSSTFAEAWETLAQS
jgi:hypothetical protein